MSSEPTSIHAEVVSLFASSPAWDEDYLRQWISPRKTRFCYQCDRKMTQGATWSDYCSKQCREKAQIELRIEVRKKVLCKCGRTRFDYGSKKHKTCQTCRSLELGRKTTICRCGQPKLVFTGKKHEHCWRCCKAKQFGVGSGNGAVPHKVVCACCGNIFEARQSEAKTCSSYCRNKLSRNNRSKK